MSKTKGVGPKPPIRPQHSLTLSAAAAGDPVCRAIRVQRQGLGPDVKALPSASPIRLRDDALMRVPSLLHLRHRELAVTNANRQALDELRHRIFAVSSHQFGEGREQAGL